MILNRLVRLAAELLHPGLDARDHQDLLERRNGPIVRHLPFEIGPGSPAVLLMAVAVVAGMQNVAAPTFMVVPGVPTRTIGSRKQRR